ncbi:MAG: hypothetical protein ABIB71_06935 [Candidatus Woesearchaeota archaeon]
MAAISLNRAEDDFLKGYSKLEAPDERMEHKVEGQVMFKGHEGLIKEYERILDIKCWNIPKGESNSYLAAAEINPVLSPEEINSFLQATIKYEGHENYSFTTGLLITRLIQNSYDAGNKRFRLDTKALSKDIHNIAYKLKGKEDNLLEIIVGGNVGNWCGDGAENIKEIYIAGDVGMWCGEWAKNIGNLQIAGNAGSFCGLKAEHSTFKTSNKETLQRLIKDVSKSNLNRIFLVYPNREEEEIKW